MRVSEVYNSYLMVDFTNILRAKYQNDSGYQFDALYRGLLNVESLKYADERCWNSFEDTVKLLADMGAYSVIVNLMYGVFLDSKEYDIDRIYKILKVITVTAEMTVADLCAEFFAYTKALQMELEVGKKEKHEALKNAITAAKDFYSTDISATYSCNSYSAMLIVGLFPEYFYARVHGYELEMEKLNSNDIDKLVKTVDM